MKHASRAESQSKFRVCQNSQLSKIFNQTFNETKLEPNSANISI